MGKEIRGIATIKELTEREFFAVNVTSEVESQRSFGGAFDGVLLDHCILVTVERPLSLGDSGLSENHEGQNALCFSRTS